MPSDMVTFAVAVLSSGAVSAIISGTLTHRTSKSVEHLRANLERGLYVTKAHYDLELESFKKLWEAMNDLRLKVRAFLGPDRFEITGPGGERLDNWAATAYPRVIEDFFKAHDSVVRTVTGQSPFYPTAIRQAAEQTFDIDMALVKRISTLDIEPMSEPWLVEVRELSAAIDRQVAEIEQLIRTRLETLRILS